MLDKTIFSDFNTVSAKAWKQKIQMDLKGADYNSTLLSNTLDGITVQPFYHKETFKSLNAPSVNKKSSICQSIFINDEKIVNGLCKEALQKGAESIHFIAKKPFEIKKIFNQLPKNINYLLTCNFYDERFYNKLISFKKEYKINIILDVINQFATEGNWMDSEKSDLENNINTAITIGVDSSLYQNAGANNVQQIAYSLAHANEYLNEIENNDLLNNKEFDFLFTFSIGSNYFFEISKIRAFRYLFNKLTVNYNAKINFKIIVKPTLRNKTIYDYNVNLLRTTTESMAAMLSKADYVCNDSYDSIYHRSNEFGTRIARNQLLVLNEESYFNTEKDIVKGTYYIEQITYELANKSLILFKDIEKNEGFLSQLAPGTIQRKIEESAKKEQNLFDKGELILLGTNKYPNPTDKMKDDLELYPFVKIKSRKTIIKPIITKRLAERLEKERLNLE